jgi:hypothetical protein
MINLAGKGCLFKFNMLKNEAVQILRNATPKAAGGSSEKDEWNLRNG